MIGSYGSARGVAGARVSTLRVDLRESLLGVSVLALAMDQWQLEAFDDAGSSVGHLVWNPPAGLNDGTYVLAELSIERSSIRFIEVTVSGSTATRGLLIMQLALKIPPIAPDRDRYREQLQQLVKAFRSEAPVFEPNSRYRLRYGTCRGRQFDAALTRERCAGNE